MSLKLWNVRSGRWGQRTQSFGLFIWNTFAPTNLVGFFSAKRWLSKIWIGGDFPAALDLHLKYCLKLSLTKHFTISVPQNLSIGEFYVLQKHQSSNLHLVKNLVGFFREMSSRLLSSEFLTLFFLLHFRTVSNPTALVREIVQGEATAADGSPISGLVLDKTKVAAMSANQGKELLEDNEAIEVWTLKKRLGIIFVNIYVYWKLRLALRFYLINWNIGDEFELE